ncbi:MAG: aspartate-semialdehyde dehydrogenase [Tissierellia bacterium]|nr:aspartate-semialdehyde dehydrogenase [Tissierellia bacterium]
MKNLAVLGATGNVGRQILEILGERDFPFGELYLFSSEKSAGEELEVKGKRYKTTALSKEAFDNIKVDLCLMAAGGAVSEEYGPYLKEKGILCIDNSSHFRMDKDVPLIVPEINKEAAKNNNGLIANPNCSTIQSVMPLKALEKFGIKRVIYSTYQAVSGSGVGGIRDLEEGVCEQYPYNIQKNCIPQIDDFLDNGYTKEEMKMMEETKKILDNDELRVTATTVRVPILNGHAVNMNIEFEKDFSLEEVRQLLEDFEGIIVEDEPEKLLYPLQEKIDGTDDVSVGRLRRDDSVEFGLNLWCVADNIRKGAATNTVQIAELFV